MREPLWAPDDGQRVRSTTPRVLKLVLGIQFRFRVLGTALRCPTHWWKTPNGDSFTVPCTAPQSCRYHAEPLRSHLFWPVLLSVPKRIREAGERTACLQCCSVLMLDSDQGATFKAFTQSAGVVNQTWVLLTRLKRDGGIDFNLATDGEDSDHVPSFDVRPCLRRLWKRWLDEVEATRLVDPQQKEREETFDFAAESAKRPWRQQPGKKKESTND